MKITAKNMRHVSKYRDKIDRFRVIKHVLIGVKSMANKDKYRPNLKTTGLVLFYKSIHPKGYRLLKEPYIIECFKKRGFRIFENDYKDLSPSIAIIWNKEVIDTLDRESFNESL